MIIVHDSSLERKVQLLQWPDISLGWAIAATGHCGLNQAIKTFV